MNPGTITNYIQRHGTRIVIAAWFIFTFLYLFVFGVVTKLEAGKYIEEAHRFIDNGAFSASRYWFYSTTLFIMIIALKLHIGMIGAFVLQAILNLFAYVLFFRALKKLFPGSIAPACIVLYLLAFWPYQSWVVFLFTESAFFSAILILLSVLILHPLPGIKNFLLITLCLLLVIISRPTGILFCGAFYVYLFIIANKKQKIIIACCSLVVAAIGIITVNTIFESIKDWTVTKPFEEESIICDLPSQGPYAQLDLVHTGSPLYQLGYYLFHNFNHFLHFAGIKLKYFFFMTRPYFSAAHNLFLLVNLIPLYLLSLAGIFKNKNNAVKGLTGFILVTILLYALTIMVQCDDYHNRFFLSIYPLIVILAAKGWITIYAYCTRKKSF